MIATPDFREKYLWKPWRTNSFELYEKEESLLHDVLASTNHNIYFFGSSSVKGVGGKGFIDIYIATDKVALVKEKLLTAGYEFQADGGDSERMFFHRHFTDKTDVLAYHVHLTTFNSKGLTEAIAFRDFLRKNKNYAEEYSEIKRLASEQAVKQPDKDSARKVYVDIKSPVIEKIMKLVRNL